MRTRRQVASRASSSTLSTSAAISRMPAQDLDAELKRRSRSSSSAANAMAPWSSCHQAGGWQEVPALTGGGDVDECSRVLDKKRMIPTANRSHANIYATGLVDIEEANILIDIVEGQRDS